MKAPARSRLLLCAALVAVATPAVADSPAPSEEELASGWMVRVARMEGASADVEQAAAALHTVAAAVAESGRIHSVSQLSAHVYEVQRKVTSARLAARVLDEPVP